MWRRQCDVPAEPPDNAATPSHPTAARAIRTSRMTTTPPQVLRAMRRRAVAAFIAALACAAPALAQSAVRPDEVDQVDLSDELLPRRWLYVYRGLEGESKVPGGQVIGEWEKVELWP